MGKVFTAEQREDMMDDETADSVQKFIFYYESEHAKAGQICRDKKEVTADAYRPGTVEDDDGIGEFVYEDDYDILKFSFALLSDRGRFERRLAIALLGEMNEPIWTVQYAIWCATTPCTYTPTEEEYVQMSRLDPLKLMSAKTWTEQERIAIGQGHGWVALLERVRRILAAGKAQRYRAV